MRSPPDLKKQIAASRRMLLTDTGLRRLFKLASVDSEGVAASTVLGVLLNLLSERDVVRSMRISGDPVRLSAVFLHMHRTGMLQYLNSVRQPLLPRRGHSARLDAGAPLLLPRRRVHR